MDPIKKDLDNVITRMFKVVTRSVRLFNFSYGRSNPWQSMRFLANKFLYDILEVKDTVEKKGIHNAYLKMTAKYHPDMPNGSVKKFIEIKQAHDFLLDDQKRKDYSAMSEWRHQEFVKKWHEENKAIMVTAVDNKEGKWLSLYKKVVNVVKKPDELVKQVKSETSMTGRYRNIQFLLDGSDSMRCFSQDDPTLNGLKFTSIRHETKDGTNAEIMDYGNNNYLLDRCTRVAKCLRALKGMLEEFKQSKVDYRVSITVFADYFKYMCNMTNYDEAYNQLNLPPKQYIIGDNTKLYDTINDAMIKFEKTGQSLDDTLFVVLTDGNDTSSTLSLDELVRIIKFKGNVHIIFVTIAITYYSNFEAIIRVAKYGKIYKAGDNISFDSIHNAVNEVNNLLRISDGAIKL